MGVNANQPGPASGPALRISVVIPVGERSDDIAELYHEYRTAVCVVDPDAEFIFVLDGADARVTNQINGLIKTGEPLKIVRLHSGAGEATSIMIGVEHASRDKILLLPAYRQVEAASLSRFVQSMGKHDLLLARRWPRRDSLFNRMATRAFSKLLYFVSGHEFDDLGCSVRLVDREVFDEVTLYGDQHRFLPLLAQQRGFTLSVIDLPQDAREPSVRLYRPGVYLRRALDVLAVFFVVKFTKKPLRFFGLVGTGMASLSLLVLLVLTYQRVFLEMPLAERPMLLLAVLIGLLGAQLFALGLIGELIIFSHAREQKEYAIAERVNFPPVGPHGKDYASKTSARLYERINHE